MTGQSADNSAAPIIALIEARERELLDLKRAVNVIYRDVGKEPKYAIDDAGTAVTSPPPSKSIRADQFYRRPLASAVREILEMKGEATAVEEIAAVLDAGGFHFEWKEEFKLKNLAISLSKNPVFHRLPNGKFGLAKSYDLGRGDSPAKKRGGRRRKKSGKKKEQKLLPGKEEES